MVDRALQEDHPSAAYHCGRLLALLDGIQRNAISPNVGLVERYYGAASTTPGIVFGNLLHGTQHHLSKLRRDKTGLAVYFDRQLESVMGRLRQFPATLSLQDQGLFALGFYHQKSSRAQSDSKETNGDVDAED